MPKVEHHPEQLRMASGPVNVSDKAVLIGAGDNDFVLASLHLWNSQNGDFYAHIGRMKGQEANHNVISTKLTDTLTRIDFSDSLVSLRIVRTGTLIESYYNGNLASSKTVNPIDVKVGLLAHRWGNVSYFDVAFDDLIIVPETTMLLLFGMGGLLIRKR